MHELSLAVEIVGLLERHAHELQRITRLTLDIGTLSCVDEQALRTALQAALIGTLADGAEVVVNIIEALALCLDCGQTFQPPDRIEPCPHCGAFRKRWLSGEDFRLRSVEGTPA
ncbi:MAG: hydrogenase maturation nickel metallochaperone HypA [Aquabacterium sp.]|uniref:hydrogenase maturation nickel metallochaperone HypA/HybF n=1 Tax=Aquabacterium sp. TaxID=1872578 RepID=UPI00120B3A05|nr:hydrogenase maturation nickel metallochaperone HypA [Aquabacterium sp.]TAK93331.1 MAG: hydrogenase maturation nickel metallochaperone HypA [Aquabacterium sp.]